MPEDQQPGDVDVLKQQSLPVRLGLWAVIGLQFIVPMVIVWAWVLWELWKMYAAVAGGR